MNTLLLISSGMAAGLGICLVLRFGWAAWAARSSPEAWRAPGALNEVLYVSAHAALGGGIGLLFWLSWGFIALVELPWWQRGLIFGMVNGVIFAVLPLLIVRSLLRTSSLLYQLLLTEILFTCLAAGLACSWSWTKLL